MLLLKRYYTPWCTPGYLYVEDKKFATMELPWKGNKQSISCIPEGVYTLGMRSSPIVKRINGYDEGWEVQDVPERTYIMFHSGNYGSTNRDTQGCILVGREMIVHKNEIMITHSQESMDEFMEIMSQRMEWDIDIQQWRPEYP